jgi:hypothetical protein
MACRPRVHSPQRLIVGSGFVVNGLQAVIVLVI